MIEQFAVGVCLACWIACVMVAADMEEYLLAALVLVVGLLFIVAVVKWG